MSDHNAQSFSGVNQFTFTLALEKIHSGSLEHMAAAGGVKYDPGDNIVEIIYFGKPCVLNCIDGTLVSYSGYKKIHSMDRALILHYLISATGRQPSGKLISFGDLSSSASFASVASMDSKLPELERIFGNNSKVIYKALEKMPGERVSRGDASIRIDVLPHISFTYVIWEGEGAIPPAVTLLFDSTTADYLPCEDIGVLAGITTLAIIEACS